MGSGFSHSHILLCRFLYVSCSQLCYWRKNVLLPSAKTLFTSLNFIMLKVCVMFVLLWTSVVSWKTALFKYSFHYLTEIFLVFMMAWYIIVWGFSDTGKLCCFQTVGNSMVVTKWIAWMCLISVMLLVHRLTVRGCSCVRVCLVFFLIRKVWASWFCSLLHLAIWLAKSFCLVARALCSSFVSH